jgi:predicted GH43/DUF377 family glycosyl hydrolase
MKGRLNDQPPAVVLGLIILSRLCGHGHGADPAAASQPDREPLFRWVKMERHPQPVLRARPGTWEASWFGVDCMIRADGRMRMYYSASDVGNTNTQLGVAYSEDGIAWQRDRRNPVWVNDWQHFLRDVRVYRFEGIDDYWLYYSDGDQHLDLAHSRDGIHWENSPHNPILEISQDWEGLVMQPSVVRLGETWYMWYATYSRGKARNTGLATSADGIRWTKHEGNPVLVVGEDGAWDDYSAFQPYVFRQDGYFHMIYTGSSKRNKTGYRWGYAWSEDGIRWTKSPDNPIFVPGPAGSWDGGKVSTHQPLRTGPRTFDIYYSGAPEPGHTYVGIGLVRAELRKMPASG